MVGGGEGEVDGVEFRSRSAGWARRWGGGETGMRGGGFGLHCGRSLERWEVGDGDCWK